MPETGRVGAAGKVEVSFATTWLATVSNNNLPVEEAKRSRRGTVATHGMVEGTTKFINKDNVKAPRLLGEAWRLAFNDKVEQVQVTVQKTIHTWKLKRILQCP